MPHLLLKYCCIVSLKVDWKRALESLQIPRIILSLSQYQHQLLIPQCRPFSPAAVLLFNNSASLYRSVLFAAQWPYTVHGNGRRFTNTCTCTSVLERYEHAFRKTNVPIDCSADILINYAQHNSSEYEWSPVSTYLR